MSLQVLAWSGSGSSWEREGGGVTDVCTKRKRQHCSDHSVAGISPLNTPTDMDL